LALLASIALQPSQPAEILYLSYTWVGVLPEGEEFLIKISFPDELYTNHRLRNIMSGPNLAETKHFCHQKTGNLTYGKDHFDSPFLP